MDQGLFDQIDIRWKQIFHQLKKVARPLLGQLDLTKVDLNILLALSYEDKLSKADLAQYLSFEVNALTRSINRLVRKGWIVREVLVTDKRYSQLSITQSGQHIIRAYKDSMRAVWSNALCGQSQQEIKHFIHVLDSIMHHLKLEEDFGE